MNSRGSEAPLVTGDNNPTFWEAAHLSLSLSLLYIFVGVRAWKMWKQQSKILVVLVGANSMIKVFFEYTAKMFEAYKTYRWVRLGRFFVL